MAKTVKRPWGEFKQFTLNEKSTVKILIVKPKQVLSLQYHKKRREFWKVLEGPAKIVIGNKTLRGKKGDEFNIPVKKKHRLGAYNKIVKVLEISFGIFDEKDEVKLEDKYGRV
ncbi:mannose-6-phosphate isomerase [Candidatus Pacearchaeota archaeon]|jgi:mannose-6-phosphate isomerase-like protein (cupin superfamily)|nr:mannose-6-phosphate isomerase [Candidatus Pacearchaeota archaeon]|tara:strand:+ start:17267 stop:17605 length:339 start_codon:yes stop_codon:yes gene_type:complete